MKTAWDRALAACLLVRLGQELGSDTPLARAVRDFLDCLLAATR